MSKLTLSIGEAVVDRAKRYAARRGTSISRLVETYLDLLSRPESAGDENVPPILARLQNALKGVRYDREDYREHLWRKYR